MKYRFLRTIFAILNGGSPHIALCVGKPRATRTSRDVYVLRTTGQVPQTDSTHFSQLIGVSPDVQKTLATNIAAGKWELHAGINFTCNRYSKLSSLVLQMYC